MGWRGGQHPASVAIGLALLLAAVEAGARDCAAPAQALACSSNDDCGCGIRAGRCDVAASECLGAGECDGFCGGRFGALAAVCRAGQCTRALATECAGDCDADNAIGIAELMVGVGIALDTSPVAACPNLDADGDGAARVDELLHAVRAALHGCAAAAGPFPGVRGYYDAELATAGAPSEAVAEVYERDDGLELNIDWGPSQTISLSGPLASGALTLSGYYLFTDVAVGISGDATVVTGADEDVISGTIRLESQYDVDLPTAFVLRRSAAENPVHFSGTLTLHFNESPSGSGLPSHATLWLDVAANGFALSGEGEDRGPNDVRYGDLTTGTCFVAPRGHLACSMFYLLAARPLPTPFRLTGRLDANGGGGDFLSGTFPPYPAEPYVVGTWSAERD